MFRARFSVWLLALTVAGVSTLLGSTARAQTSPSNRLFPSKAPAQSDALRSPARRPLPTPRPDTVSLPYNLVWGDTQNRLAALFAGVGAKITNKKTEGSVETWTVEGLIAPNLVSSLFTFQDAQLAALEFDYGQPDWDLPKYNEIMGQFRRLLEAKCEKPGEMVTRDSDQPTPEGLKQSFMGYKWSRGDTLVQLFYFSAEDPAKSLAYRSISVHYHYQDPFPPSETAELPASPNADPNLSPLFGGSAKPTPVPAQTPAATAMPEGGSPTPGSSPGGSPAPSLAAGPEQTPLASPTASPTPTPKGGKKKAKPKPTPDGESLPLPEH